MDTSPHAPSSETTAAAASAAAMPARLRWLPVAAPLLGLLSAATLLLHGFVLEDELPLPSVMVTIVPAFILALLVGTPPREHPRRLVLQAAPPAAIGLVVVTTLFGLTLVESPVWWIGGAIGSAVPFFVAAFAARPPLP